MDGDRRRKLRKLFDQAQDLEPEALGVFLDQACVEDPGLRLGVESLLEKEGRSRNAAEVPARAEAASLLIGQEIGRYRIVDKLGEGGMGEVFLARDLDLRREVALKVLARSVAEDPVGLERFKREARALAAVDHPNIVTIHSVEEEEGLTFLTMERVEGVSLDRAIPEGGLEVVDLVTIANSVADALAVAHAKGITHRDLKPANIMIGEGQRVKILDFGLAKLRPEGSPSEPSQLPTRTLTQMGIAMGTIPYMSPEQVEGKEVDHRSDLFSLGIVLYEMATGRRPFEGDTAPAVMSSILKDTPVPASQRNTRVPRRLDGIISRCLQKSPGGRPQSASEIVEALELVKTESAGSWPMSWFSDLTTTSPGASVRKTGWIAATILAVAIAVSVVWNQTASPPARIPIRSLAVLPLDNHSENSGQDYFVDGMTEALITDLAKIGALKVISRTSAMLYRDSDKPLPQIARELGVDAVVEGSVFRAGEQVRITVQLIEADTDEHLWAESYDRELRDILSLQSEVARAIAREIEAQLTPAEEQLLTAKRPVDPEAYDAYLQGLFHFYAYQVEQAREYFELALDRDPDFALAYAGLANTWGARVQYGGTPPGVGIPRGKELALKAVEIDDTLAEAHNVLAKFAHYWDWDWPAAETGFKRALELNPNSPLVRYSYSLFLGSLKRHEEGLEQIDRALQLDPLNPLLRAVRGWQLVMTDRYGEAIEAFRVALAAGPVVPAQVGLWTALWAQEKRDEAWIEAKKTFSLMGRTEVVEAMDLGHAESGYRGAMLLAAERLVASSEQQYVPQTMIAKLYAHAEEEDPAIDWLETAYRERDTLLVYLSVEPDWDGLRADPRFRRLLGLLGLPE